MSRNPYIAPDQEPTLRKSVFVLMDILGYSDLIRQAQCSGSQEAVLRDLHSALSTGRSYLENSFLPLPVVKLLKMDFALKAFTDNIVIGWLVRSDAEFQFLRAFSCLAQFQLTMAIRGYFVRGAISVGLAYIDEVAVFGDALIEAYDGESKRARDPRIILTESAIHTAQHHLTFYDPPAGAPHVRDILKDADGQWFLNYLDSVLIAGDDYGPFYSEFLQHKEAVERKLSEHAANPAVWAKYAWVAGYHNYFCDLHPEYFTDEHRIKVELFRAAPTLIV